MATAVRPRSQEYAVPVMAAIERLKERTYCIECNVIFAHFL